MAIVGFIVHAQPASSPEIEKKLGAMPAITTYGIHDESFIVAVADAPASTMESLINSIKKINGVLTCYVTSFHDEEGLE